MKPWLIRLENSISKIVAAFFLGWCPGLVFSYGLGASAPLGLSVASLLVAVAASLLVTRWQGQEDNADLAERRRIFDP